LGRAWAGSPCDGFRSTTLPYPTTLSKLCHIAIFSALFSHTIIPSFQSFIESTFSLYLWEAFSPQAASASQNLNIEDKFCFSALRHTISGIALSDQA
jgi:hypothetical protein